MNKLQIQVPTSGHLTRVKLATALCFVSLLAGDVAAPIAQAQTVGGSFKTTGAPKQDREFHIATLLGDGTVLVAGGMFSTVEPIDSYASAELYNPATGKFKATGSMAIPRSHFTATRLKDGRVLVVGGSNSGVHLSDDLASAELYNRATGQFKTVGSLRETRSRHAAALLPSGKVLIVGGENVKGDLASAELYSPATGRFTRTGALHTAISEPIATVLQNGRVLVTGSDAANRPVAEVYDPSKGQWIRTGEMKTTSHNFSVTALPSGGALIVGGISQSINVVASAELYDPKTGEFTTIGPMTQRRWESTLTVLESGKVLICGGNNDIIGTLSSAELYDPATRKFTAIAPMKQVRQDHLATRLRNGQVLLTGGFFGETAPVPELYVPAR